MGDRASVVGLNVVQGGVAVHDTQRRLVDGPVIDGLDASEDLVIRGGVSGHGLSTTLGVRDQTSSCKKVSAGSRCTTRNCLPLRDLTETEPSYLVTAYTADETSID